MTIEDEKPAGRRVIVGEDTKTGVYAGDIIKGVGNHRFPIKTKAISVDEKGRIKAVCRVRGKIEFEGDFEIGTPLIIISSPKENPEKEK